MNWLCYLLEANLYLTIFYGFYRLLLHRETFYQWNRYYLLGTSALAFLIPLFQISYLDSLLHPVREQATITVQYSGELVSAVQNAPVLNIEDVLFASYLLVVTYFIFQLGTSVYGILRMAASADKTRKEGIIQVHFSQSDTAFSFFNLLFMNPGTDNKHIILQHEMIHIRQKHSFDILFFELLLISSWFNPVCWLIRQDIKLVHEYIADEATTSGNMVKHDYAMFLIQNSFGPFSNPLTSQMFNQSILKNRISMLNKKRSAGRARLRLLYVFPLSAGMLCVSTLSFAKDYAFIDLYAGKQKTLASAVQKVSPQEKQYFFIKDNDKRLLVLNGKKLDKKGIITIEGFDKMVELNEKRAAEKYGSAGAEGAVEFAGKNTMATNKFPPPVVKLDPPQEEAQQQNKKTYTLETVYDAKIRGTRPVKLVVINGKISRARNYTTVSRFDEVKELGSTEAMAKYGTRASKGALEFTGKNAGVDIKFPPPIPEKAPKAPKKPAPVEEVKLLPPPPPAKPGAAPLAPPTPDQNGKVKFPPPAPQKPKKPETIKFPPPVVKPMEKLEDYPETKTNSQNEFRDVGPNPLFVNNGSITAINRGEGKTISFTAKSTKIIPKNNAAAISKYGESAKDGVIELEDGQFFIALPGDNKNFVPLKKD